MNKSLEAEIVLAEQALQRSPTRQASRSELHSLKLLQGQLAELEAEVDYLDEENSAVQIAIRALIEELQSSTGLNLNDSLDEDRSGGSGDLGAEKGVLSRLVQAKCRAIFFIERKLEIEAAVRKEFAFNADDDFY